MKPVFIRRATEAEAADIAARLRPEDRDEVLASIGVAPEVALPEYVRDGREVYVAGLQEDNIPEIIFGADPIPNDPEGATIWMLCTPRIYRFPVEFASSVKDLFEAYHARYPFLTNFTDARNTAHHRLIKWLGFTILRRVEEFGAESRPFLEFASYRP